jgi:hypothetical protein
MPANQSKMDPTQSRGIVKRGEQDKTEHQTYLRESLNANQDKLRRTLISLSEKLEEVENINQRLFQAIDSNATSQTVKDKSDEKSSDHEGYFDESSSSSHLVYQLSSLMNCFKSILDFANWGIFSLQSDTSGSDDPEKGYKEVTSSGNFEMNQSTRDFESEVRSQYACGNIQQAIGMKKRMHFPAERGDMLIVPLPLSDGKNGFWALHFDKGMPSLSDSAKELLIWGTDLIATCLKNVDGNVSYPSPSSDDGSWLEREKVCSLTLLSRAMVHEVNNSMQIILGRAQIARMNLSKSNEEIAYHRIWETIENNANRINGILKNFSDFLHRHSSGTPIQTSRVSEKNLSVSTKEVNLHRILEGNLALLHYILGSSGIQLEMKSGNDLPLVYANPEELELAFLGLLWGIKDSLTEGGEIRIQAISEGGFLVLNIDWTGGIGDKRKSPGESRSGDPSRLNQAIRMLEKFDHDMRFENITGKEGRVVLKISAVPDKTQPNLKEAES